MGIIKTFEEFIKESIWADMEDRGTGDLVKKEDDVNTLDCTDFFEYLKTRYEGYCNTNYIGRKDNYIKFYLSVGCRLHIMYNDDGKTIREITTEPFDKDFFSTFEEELKSKNVRHNLTADFDGVDTFEIKDKNGNTSNRTVIEFVDNYFNYVIDEEGEKILLKLCDKLRPDYEKGEEITIDKILKLAKYELVVNRYSKKERFFNFIEKNYDDILGIIKNGSGVNESIWTDMQDKGNGVSLKKEDDLSYMDFDDFAEYIDDNFFANSDWFATTEGVGEDTRHIEIDIISGITLQFNVCKEKIYNILICIHMDGRYKDKKVDTNKLEKVFSVEPRGKYTIGISELDGSVSNNTYVKLIKFFIEHKNDLITESVWSDMEDRGTGDKIKTEDNLENMDIEEFCEYCKNRYWIDPKTMGISISKISNSYYIGVPGFHKKYFLFFYLRYMNSGKKTIDFVNGILDQIPEVKQKLEDRYDLRRRPGSVDRFPDYRLFPKDGSPVTNALFIDMLDYLDSSEDLDHIPGLKKYFKKK